MAAAAGGRLPEESPSGETTAKAAIYILPLYSIPSIILLFVSPFSSSSSSSSPVEPSQS